MDIYGMENTLTLYTPISTDTFSNFTHTFICIILSVVIRIQIHVFLTHIYYCSRHLCVLALFTVYTSIKTVAKCYNA